MALHIAGAAPSPPPEVRPLAPPPAVQGGHTQGLDGRFQIEAKSRSGFAAALQMFSSRLVDPEATVLKWPILSPEEWINSPYHSGPLGQEMWPRKKEDFIKAAQGDVTEVIVTGAIGLGKTQKMKMLAAYDRYRLSCFPSPQQALGIASSETIVMVLVSLNLQKARAKLFDPLRNLVESIPYFREHCMPDSRRMSEMHFPDGVIIKPGITGEGAVHSEDVIWIGVSEANFLPIVTSSAKKRGQDELDVAADLVEASIRRMKSRFMRGDSALPLCRIVLDSSRDLPDSYLEQRIVAASAGKGLGHKVVVQSNAIWEEKRGVKDPTGKLYFSGVTFPVELGDDHRSSRILTEEEVQHAAGEVLRCAIECLPAFERDLEGSIRDMAGRASLALRRFLPNRKILDECIRDDTSDYPAATLRHPFSSFATSLSDGVALMEALLINPETGKPWLNPESPRAVHIDVGLSNDALGFAMGHISEMVMTDRAGIIGMGTKCRRCGGEGSLKCERCIGKGRKKQLGVEVECIRCKGKGDMACVVCDGAGVYASKILRPRVVMDLVLEVIPPDGGQIQFSALETLLQHLENLGFAILSTTADGTYSAQFLQRQTSEFGRIYVEKLSVDANKDPYLSLKEAMYDVAEDGQRRWSMYDHPALFRELRFLEEKPKKIDHPPKGKKNMADAVAGVCHACHTLPVLQYKLKPATVSVQRY